MKNCNPKLQHEFFAIEKSAKDCAGKIVPEKLVETVVRQCFEAASKYDAASVALGNAGASAFPVVVPDGSSGGNPFPAAGMTKREEFAKCFLAGLLASPNFYSALCGKEIDSPGLAHQIAAKEAINFADALLERFAK